MNIKKLQISHAFCFFMRTQLFLSLISLPILVAWGLPLSSMTIVGNLICSPFLMVFLLLSSLIFFCELCHIPSFPLIFLFEKLCTLWKYFLHCGSVHWLYAIDKTGFWICVICALGALVVFQHKSWGSAKKSWPLLALLFCIPFCFQKIRSLWPLHYSITCINKTADITKKNGLLFLCDHGALGEKKSAGSWIQYTFLPEIIKQCGSLHFDTITLCCPRASGIKALCLLCHHAPIKKIVVHKPVQKSKKYRAALADLQAEVDQRGIELLLTKSRELSWIY